MGSKILILDEGPAYGGWATRILTKEGYKVTLQKLSDYSGLSRPNPKLIIQKSSGTNNFDLGLVQRIVDGIRRSESEIAVLVVANASEHEKFIEELRRLNGRYELMGNYYSSQELIERVKNLIKTQSGTLDDIV